MGVVELVAGALAGRRAGRREERGEPAEQACRPVARLREPLLAQNATSKFDWNTTPVPPTAYGYAMPPTGDPLR